MPRGGFKVCSHPGCPHLRPCPNPEHKPKAWVGSDRQGSTRQGRKVRERILERDPICMICYKNPSTVCDHIWQVAHGAPERYEDTPEELLRGICKPCNDKLSAAQGAAGRRRNADQTGHKHTA